MRVCTRGVHGNGEDWDPMGPMGFPWEWEQDQPWDGNGMGMGIKCMGMGVKTWELEKRQTTLSPATANSLLFLHSNIE